MKKKTERIMENKRQKSTHTHTHTKTEIKLNQQKKRVCMCMRNVFGNRTKSKKKNEN